MIPPSSCAIGSRPEPHATILDHDGCNGSVTTASRADSDSSLASSDVFNSACREVGRFDAPWTYNNVSQVDSAGYVGVRPPPPPRHDVKPVDYQCHSATVPTVAAASNDSWKDLAIHVSNGMYNINHGAGGKFATNSLTAAAGLPRVNDYPSSDQDEYR